MHLGLGHAEIGPLFLQSADLIYEEGLSPELKWMR